MKTNGSIFFAILFVGALTAPGATTVGLGTATSFAVLAGSAVTNTGPTTVTGDLGVWPGAAVTGFPPGLVNGGTIHITDAVAMQAQTDLTTAFNAAAGQPCDVVLTGQDLGGLTLTPGVYCFATSAQLTGALTLDGLGNPNAAFVFQMGTTLTTASGSSILVTNGAGNNVFWQVGSSATLGTTTQFRGTILALASITLNTGTNINCGRALARNGAVTMDTNVVSTSAACVTLVQPSITETFVPPSMPTNSLSTLTISVTNPNTFAESNYSFSDALPPGMTLMSVNSNACGTASSTSSSINQGSFALGAGASCSLVATVQGVLPGTWINPVIGTGELTGSTGMASLTVLATPSVSKTFGTSPIAINGTTVLTISITNPNLLAVANVGFTDLLPAGMVVAAIPNASFSGNCGAPTLTATAGSGSVTLSGGTLAAANPNPCIVTVTVRGTTAGQKTNSVSVNSDIGTSATAMASVTVVQPDLTVGKTISPATIGVGGSGVVTIVLSQTSAVSVTGVGFVDTLPAGLVVAAVPNASFAGNCGAATLTAVAGATTVTLSGGTLAGGNANPCTVTVTLTGTTLGLKTNSVQANSDQGLSNIASASVTVLTVAPPAISKSFGSPSVSLLGITTLTIRIVNPNAAALSGVAFTDALPTGILIGLPPGLTSSGCGGTISATGGSGVVSLTSGTIAAGIDCVITLNVQGTVVGTQVNNTGNVTAIVGGNVIVGNTAAATLIVGQVTDAYLIGYAVNLNVGDSILNLTNTGSQNGNVCANVYTYSADEQLVSCCACLVTPNGLASLSTVNDLISNPLTPIRPSSTVVKLVATAGGSSQASCNAASVGAPGASLASGLVASGTTIHPLPITAGTPVGTYALVENPLRHGTLSGAELTRVSQLCGFLQANGSGYGICRTCRLGGLGAANK